MELHPNLSVLAPLLGNWQGQGEGEYPTIEPFSYSEQVTFGHVGKPFVSYLQKTKSPTGQPMHTESGYLRAVGEGRVEFVLSMPTGQVEVGNGTVVALDGGVRVEIECAVHCTEEAKSVTRTRRVFVVQGDQLDYTLDMEAVGQELTLHLTGHLTRQG